MGHCSLGVVVRRAVVKGKAGVAGGGQRAAEGGK